jgi:predicted DNA-binding protein (MmcQ/YjbR family)
MITEEQFLTMALSFAETSFDTKDEVTRFFVAKKKFASIRFCKNRASVKLSKTLQDVFCSYKADVMYPVPSAYAKYGWTHINLQNIEQEMCLDAITMAYCEVAPKYLADRYRYE